MSAARRIESSPRVVVLVKRFPRLSETFILNEFLELRRQNLSVELVAVMDPGESRSHPEALALVPEVTYLQRGRLTSCLPAALRALVRHPLGGLRAAGWAAARRTRAAGRNVLHALVLVDHLDRSGGAHLHAHFLHTPAAIAYLAKKVSGQRFTLSGHAKDIYTSLPGDLRARCAAAECVTTCTDANRRHLVEEIGLPARKVHLCRHGVDAARFAAAPPEPQPGRILSVGRLVAKKGFDVLISACGELARAGCPFELRIVGAGELRAELLALAAAEGISDRVTLVGGVSQDEVARELAAAEVFALAPVVMPDGDRDGIPNVLLEALAAGLPVAATAVSGIPELLCDGVNARLVEPGKAGLLADALASLLSDPDERRRLGEAGRRLVSEEWTWPAAVAPLRRLLLDAASPHGAEAHRAVLAAETP